jgi:methylthioribose-1-phosphate isomerase
MSQLTSLRWIDGHLELLDQTLLPGEITWKAMPDLATLREAIIALRVRGAPAIGVAAGYGIAEHTDRVAKTLDAGAAAEALRQEFSKAFEILVTSRPTAVNLRWALERQRDCYEGHVGILTAKEMAARLIMEARRIHAEDIQLCSRIADNGAPLLAACSGVMTICNTGALATAGVGTAFGCIHRAVERGAAFTVYPSETRPLLQGARLTALELHLAGIPVKLMTDNMAASVMRRRLVQAVIAGADRITANGDAANKIGTYQLAVLARYHGIPFYIAAPYSTFDCNLASGDLIEIEERNANEVRSFQGILSTHPDVGVVNPAFDVTPAELITAIITERGVIHHPTTNKVMAMMK